MELRQVGEVQVVEYQLEVEVRVEEIIAVAVWVGMMRMPHVRRL